MDYDDERGPLPTPALIAAVAALIMFVSCNGLLAEQADMCISGVIGMMAVTVSQFGRGFAPLSRVAFVIALICTASGPVIAWNSAHAEDAVVVRSTSDVAVMQIVATASEQALGRKLTAQELRQVEQTRFPLGKTAPDRFNVLLDQRFRRDEADGTLRNLQDWQWAFYQDMCRALVTYAIDDRNIAPLLRRYIAAYASDDLRFRLDPDLVTALRKLLVKSPYRSTLATCARIFEFSR